jgi:hypothetical protein
MTGTAVFIKGTTGTVNVSKWLAMRINPSSDATCYYNSATTATFPISSGAWNVIILDPDSITSVTCALGAATAYVQGM